MQLAGQIRMRLESIEGVVDRRLHVQSHPLHEIQRPDTIHSLIRGNPSIPSLALSIHLSLFSNHSFNKFAVLFLPLPLASISEVYLRSLCGFHVRVECELR